MLIRRIERLLKASVHQYPADMVGELEDSSPLSLSFSPLSFFNFHLILINL